MNPDPSPPGVETRRAALRLLDAVLRRGLPLEAALDGATRDLERSDDRGLAHAIAAEALRRLPDLDALIDSVTQKRLASDAKARFALRIALVQALALGTPPHAAIATVLPLVDGGPRRLVHGVFGALMRRQVAMPATPSLPRGVEERWMTAWGRDMVDAARLALAQPPLDLSFVDGAAARCFKGEHLADRHARIPAQGRIAELPGFAEGQWWVQDLAASIPARLLGAGEGRQVLDLCAAPGGKTLQLAAAGWNVTAVDSSAARLQRLSENLGRTGLVADIIEADIMQWQPAVPVDAILLDAPCSATGIFRRHPDVLHRVGPKIIAEMAGLQRAMLERTAQWLNPGGTLVFSTCSLEPQEGESHRDHAGGLKPDPIDLAELPTGVAPHPQGHLRTLPTMIVDKGALDGFFIARFKR